MEWKPIRCVWKWLTRSLASLKSAYEQQTRDPGRAVSFEAERLEDSLLRGVSFCSLQHLNRSGKAYPHGIGKSAFPQILPN